MCQSRFLPVFLLTFCASGLFSIATHGEVDVKVLPSPISVAAQGYQARIDSDGCLSSLVIEGSEFLAAGVSISRGSYFFQGGPLKLDHVEKAGDNLVTVKSKQASIRYEFDEDTMRWKLANLTDEPMVFFFVLSDALEAVITDKGDYSRPAIELNTSQATFCIRNGALSIDGIDRLWGPWQGPHQVAEVSLPPRTEKQLTLKAAPFTPEQRTHIAALVVPPVEPELEVVSPRMYQVFQRTREREGTILVSGRTRTDATEVECKIVGESAYGELPASWTPLSADMSTGRFNQRVTLPAGGWYSLQVRALDDGEVLAEKVVEQFGVGEVFVGAGQSNSTNSGQFRTQQTTGMVSSFSGDRWQLADDPQPGVADRSQGGSFWPAFGDALYEKYRVPIGVATTGFGGTSVNRWQPDGDLFNWTMTRIHQLGPLGFRALLWHQGESDVEMPSDEYYAKLKNVILASRTRAGWDFPWFVAQASYHNPDKPKSESVRSAQARLWNSRIAQQGPDTDTLVGEHRDFDGKGIHFSPKGLKVHGEMWAQKMSEHIDRAFEQGDGIEYSQE